MHPYLPHLISEIKAAHKKEEPELHLSEDNLEEHFLEIERMISGDAAHTLSYFCGLLSEDFPPGNLFTGEEKWQLCRAFEEMLRSWGADVSLPEVLPIDNRYELIVGLLERHFTPFQFGTLVFDFCTGYDPDCELGKYCPCLGSWNNEL
jgi:hypothetical protein